MGAGMGAGLEEQNYEMPGVAHRAIAGGFVGAYGGAVAGIMGAVAIVSSPVGWCIGIGAVLGTSVGGVVGLLYK